MIIQAKNRLFDGFIIALIGGGFVAIMSGGNFEATIFVIVCVMVGVLADVALRSRLVRR